MKKLFILLMLISPMARGQANLYISDIGGASTTALTSSTDSVTFFSTTVKNLAIANDFNDTLRIYIGVKDVLGQTQVMTVADVGLQNILAQDSINLASVTVDVNPSFFQDGNNTVVIWPACPGNFTYDSLFFTVTYAHIDDLILNDIRIVIGPNPASDRFYLGDPENVVKQVRIVDLQGNILYTGSANQIIGLNGFAEGLYLIELQTMERSYARKLMIRR